MAVDEEYNKIVVATVEPVTKKPSTTSVLPVEPSQKVAEKTAKKRKVQEEPKVRQTRSNSKLINDGKDLNLFLFFHLIFCTNSII